MPNHVPKLPALGASLIDTAGSRQFATGTLKKSGPFEYDPNGDVKVRAMLVVAHCSSNSSAPDPTPVPSHSPKCGHIESTKHDVQIYRNIN